MRRDLNVTLSLLTAFVLLLAVNLIAAVGLRNVNVDLTDEKLYSLSEGSRALLGKLDDQIQVKLFYSRRPANALPAIKQYADRVIELLRQYQRAGGGKIRLEILEPRPDTEIEEQALSFGLKAIPLQGQESLYFGLVVVSEVGAEDAVPFLDPAREDHLEYDISRLISGVARPEKKTIGVMSALSVMGGFGSDPLARLTGRPPAEPWVFVQELQNAFEVREIPMDAKEVDEDVDLLLVIHPKDVRPATEYAIDQFVLRGGRLIAMIDPHSEFDARNFSAPDPSQRFQAKFDSTLPTLLKAWGLEMDSLKVLGDLQNATLINTERGPVQYLPFLSLTEANCNQDEIISSRLEQILVGSGGGLKIVENPPYPIVPLIESPASVQEIDAFMLKFGTNPDQLARDYVPGNRRFSLAAKVTGKLKTAFPGGPPRDDGDKAEAFAPTRPHLAEAAEATTLLVIADVDMFADMFSVQVRNLFGFRLAQTINDNLNFLNNAIEVMSGSQELIGLRTRGKSARPFARVNELEREAQRRFKAEEDELNRKLDEAGRRLRELEAGRDEGGRQILSAEQVAEIEKFRQEQVQTRKALRDVRRKLRQDIESLGFRLKFINIALMPILAILASAVPAAWRVFRMRSTP